MFVFKSKGTSRVLKESEDIRFQQKVADKMAVFPPIISGDILAERFLIIEPLSADVFTANDQSNNRPVVIKRGDNEALQREFRCIKQCRSPYIINALEYLPLSSLLVMPYLQGTNLLAFSASQRALFMSLIAQIVRAVSYLHAQGWVHGDIKPSNIIYQAELGIIKLIDFGATWPIDTPLIILSQWQLTPGFSRHNKEQGIGTIEPADDWYALAQWLKQIDQSALTVREKNCLECWIRWLKKRY
ncbi:MAG: serine/threonine protein kinase [Sphingobacteriales bacterium]|jgi:serine/threonine protein kinase